MPERLLIVDWPDQHRQSIYSPSSIIESYFEEGDKLSSDLFVARCTRALEHASQRVQEKYGFACTAAMESIEKIKAKHEQIETDTGQVEVIEIR
ncbi:MAG: MSMEG_0570 family nitrogen starvation response protein [Bacteroidota bacterium]